MAEQNNIKMKPINEDSQTLMEDALLAEEGDVLIWANDGDEKTIFINIGNATVSMPEKIFYTLTKLTQKVSKILLGID